MKCFAWVFIASCSLAAYSQTTPAKPEPVEHTFVIHNFHTESGVTLPEAKVVYGTYGHLNAAGDNAILLPSHYMADMRGYDWLIGPGKALDPERQFLITSELFGNGRSSSPSNTPEPFHGPRFPVTTIRDNVEAVHQLLTAGARGPAPRSRHRVLHGSAAGLPMGCLLSRLHGPHRCHLGHGQDLRPRHRPPGERDHCADHGRGLSGRGLQGGAGEGNPGISRWYGPRGSFLKNGGARSYGSPRNPPEPPSPRWWIITRRTSFPEQTRTISFCRCTPGNSMTWEPLPASAEMWGRRWDRSRHRSSTCPRRRTCISPSPMPAMKRPLSLTAPCCLSLRCGATRPAPGRARRTKNFSTSTSRPS